jgi:hypothetical protein
MSDVTAVVDAHVHLHACYQADELLDCAWSNLSRACAPAPAAPPAFFLLMAETHDDDCFGQLRALALRGGAPDGLQLRAWTAEPTSEQISLVLAKGPQRLFVMAGRQVACREGLELLILGTTRKFDDGRPIRDLLSETDALGVPRVIPWGPGKWLFNRGRLLSHLLQDFRKPTLFLGDEGGRPGFWGYPSHFARAARLGVRDLPGTDPLPFAHDVRKVGRMGFCVPMDLDPERPAASLIRCLIDPAVSFERFARLEPPLRFVRNQIGMQLRKRRLA